MGGKKIFCVHFVLNFLFFVFLSVDSYLCFLMQVQCGLQKLQHFQACKYILPPLNDSFDAQLFLAILDVKALEPQVRTVDVGKILL